MTEIIPSTAPLLEKEPTEKYETITEDNPTAKIEKYFEKSRLKSNFTTMKAKKELNNITVKTDNRSTFTIYFIKTLLEPIIFTLVLAIKNSPISIK